MEKLTKTVGDLVAKVTGQDQTLAETVRNKIHRAVGQPTTEDVVAFLRNPWVIFTLVCLVASVFFFLGYYWNDLPWAQQPENEIRPLEAREDDPEPLQSAATRDALAKRMDHFRNCLTSPHGPCRRESTDTDRQAAATD